MTTVTSTTARARLADVPLEKQFWCSDGRALKNLVELQVALNEMSEEVFRYHSNETRNDFSNWVREVIGEDKLSRDLRKSRTKAEAAKVVASRIAWLKSKAGIG